MQAQEQITALHHACQQLESSATGKAAEARLQKALNKLHKLDLTPPSAVAAAAAVAAATAVGHTLQSSQAEAETAPEREDSGGAQGSLPAIHSSALESSKHAAADRIGDGASIQPSGNIGPAIAKAGALDGAQPTATQQVAVLPAEGPADQSSAHETNMTAEQDKHDRKAQKEEAKVSVSRLRQHLFACCNQNSAADILTVYVNVMCKV